MANSMQTIVLTGATGFLGSHLMASLVRNGHRVIVFGRSHTNDPLIQRINRLLSWFELEQASGQIECIETDLLKKDLGIGDKDYSRLCTVTDTLIHCASDTSFAESKRERVISSNVLALDGILHFARQARIKMLHYISTVFVAGKVESFCREILPSASTFTNVYEESKANAETTISEFCASNSIPLSIIRPSIVYGDSRTGRSLKFNALYFPVHSAVSIMDIYQNDLKNNGGKKSQKAGISIDSDGYMHLPLRIYLPCAGNINLIPIDYFVNASIRIIEKCSSGGIFHLSNDSPMSLDIIVRYFEKMMKVKGIEVIYNGNNGVFRNPAEELFARYIGPYRPYLSDNKIFDRKNTNLVTEGLVPPEFTYEIFEKCMNFAIKASWGEKIFSS